VIYFGSEGSKTDATAPEEIPKLRKISDDNSGTFVVIIFSVNQRKRAQGLAALAEVTMAVAIIAFLRTIGR
jgi:hypothetical protein